MIHQKANEEFGWVGKRRRKTCQKPIVIKTTKSSDFKILHPSLLPKGAFSAKVHPRNEPIFITKTGVVAVFQSGKPHTNL